MRVSLVIPTLNERGSIETLLRHLADVLGRMRGHYTFEIILVDDGSSDGTPDAAALVPLPFPLQVIRRNERGLATAVLAGFAAASGDVLGVMDADLSHPVETIPALLWRLEDADIAIGSRHVPGGMVEEWPWYRLYASLFMTRIADPLAGNIRDPLSGFFFLRRPVLEGVKLSPVGYKILLEILVKGKYERAREAPYVFRNRGVGKSKMGLREAWNYLRHLGRLYWWKFYNS